MTTKMQSCIDHIKTSHDVDPWAMEMVERIFTEYDKRFDQVLEIIDKVIEGQMKQAERFNGSGCHVLAKIYQDQAYGAQMAKQAIEALKGGNRNEDTD